MVDIGQFAAEDLAIVDGAIVVAVGGPFDQQFERRLVREVGWGSVIPDPSTSLLVQFGDKFAALHVVGIRSARTGTRAPRIPSQFLPIDESPPNRVAHASQPKEGTIRLSR